PKDEKKDATKSQEQEEKKEDKKDEKKEDKKDEKQDEKKDEKKDEKAYSGPTTSAKRREVPSMRDRLADYLSTNKTRVDREELGWLIAAWGAGPGVVLLDPSLSWQRSEVSPLETFLDRNGDGTFSREEIAQADSDFQRADVDSNDVVDMNEIRRALDHPAFALAVGGYPLVVVLDANTDALKLQSTMASIYKTQPSAASSMKESVPTVADLQA